MNTKTWIFWEVLLEIVEEIRKVGLDPKEVVIELQGGGGK